MEEQERKIWQRVTGGMRQENCDIRPLLLAATENAAVFGHLAGLLSGKPRERMRGLRELAGRTLDGLKGIQAMSGYPAGDLRPPLIPREPARRLLEKSYHRSRQLITEYTARMTDPEYGVVYQTLADRERETAAVLAEVIGSLEV